MLSKLKKIKKPLIILGVAVLVLALTWGILKLISNNSGSVNCYLVSDMSMTDFWGDSSETSGTVTADRIQKVYLSGTQTVSSVYVKEGQEVKKGDKLLSYDTSMSSIDVERANISVERAELELQSSINELETLNKLSDKDALIAQRKELEKELEAAKAASGGSSTEPQEITEPRVLGGLGTPYSPLYIEVPSGTALTQTMLSEYFVSTPLKSFIAVVTREGDIEGAAVESCWGYLIEREYDGGEITLSPAECDEWIDPVVEPAAEVKALQKKIESLDTLIANSLTKSEISRQIIQKNQEIANNRIEVSMAKLDLRRLMEEINDCYVYAAIDGVVKTVRDSGEAKSTGEAVIDISGGGGYIINATIGELDLGSVAVGNTVTVNSWMSGESYEGTIVEIGDTPTSSDEDYYSYVQSSYPMKVSVSEDANLQVDNYVSISYTPQEQSGAFYLDNMYIRTENGKSFVYVEGENGRLEQRDVQVGKIVYDSYTEIRGGITLDDYIAFPYGRTVKDGAPVHEATLDELYMSY